MPKIRSTEEIAEKYTRVTPGRSKDYEDGVKAPKEDWEAKTAGSESSWEQGVQSAIGEKRFGKGVKKAGTAKWQRKTLAVGPTRWGPGVTGAGDDYKAGFAPFRDKIESITLPPRGPKGDPRNIERVTIIATELHKLKTR